MLTKYYDQQEMINREEFEKGEALPVYGARVIHNGTTTISFGILDTYNTASVFGRVCEDIRNEIFDMADEAQRVVYKGVAHLSSEDTYNKRTGVIVSSRKAEHRAMSRQLKRLKAIQKKTQLLLDRVNEELEATEARLGRIESRMKS